MQVTYVLDPKLSDDDVVDAAVDVLPRVNFAMPGRQPWHNFTFAHFRMVCIFFIYLSVAES